jgi:proteic killer suppression protein
LQIADDRPLIPLTLITRRVIIKDMIRSFADKRTERLFQREPVKGLPAAVQRAALRKLAMLNAAISLDDLKVPPGNRLEKLAGDRAGQFGIRVNDQWRICFRWSHGEALDVGLFDYN